MPNILCFGDSNTNGSNPSGGRWGRHERWTGVLQDILGDEYYVIEEGLGGRVAVMEDFLEPNKNGRTHLPVCLRTHRPLDLVIIMLGTNDMKHRFSLLARDIAQGIADLGKLVERYDYGGPWYPIPKVMLISPIELGDGIENSVFGGFSPDAVAVSKELHLWIEKEARANGWYYLNAADYARPSERDKLHIELDGQNALARAVEAKVREIFG